jgi:hypothetical protein
LDRQAVGRRSASRALKELANPTKGTAMPLRPLDEELVREAPRRERPEAKSRRPKRVRMEAVVEREDARGNVRDDAREDSRA